MERERQRTHSAPGPEPEGGDQPASASAGGALQAARGWESVAQEAAGECESASDAERELQRRAQRSGQ